MVVLLGAPFWDALGAPLVPGGTTMVLAAPAFVNAMGWIEGWWSERWRVQ